MEMDVKTFHVIVKNKSTTTFHVRALIEHRNDHAVKPFACGLWFHLSFEHFDVISMVDKSTDLGEFLSIKFLLIVLNCD